MLGVNAHKLTRRRWLRYNLTVRAQALNMKFDCFLYEVFDFLLRLTGGYTARKIGNIGAVARGTTFDDNKVLHVQPHFFKLACLRALLKVPGGISTLGLPDTVTVPGFVG